MDANAPKCQAADGCTNAATWQVAGRLVKPHVCCDDCKRRWKEILSPHSAGAVTFKRLKQSGGRP